MEFGLALIKLLCEKEKAEEVGGLMVIDFRALQSLYLCSFQHFLKFMPI